MILPNRLRLVQAKVDELYDTYKIAEYPILTHEFVKKHFYDKIVIKTFPYNDNAEIVTNYYPDYDKAIMLVNRRRITNKLHKRLNFSFAHELGHILLDHQRYYIKCPGVNLKFLEDEADEFAARFLVPEEELRVMMYSNNKAVVKYLSTYFHVSESVIRIRIENIKGSALQPGLGQAIQEIDFDRYVEFR